MRLGTLESGCHTTGSQLVAEEDMLDGVDSAGAQQGGPARAEKEVGRSGEAGHDGYPAIETQPDRNGNRKRTS